MDSESVIVTNCDDEARCVRACLVTLCKKSLPVPSPACETQRQRQQSSAYPHPPTPRPGAPPPPVTTLSHDCTHMTSTLPSSAKAIRVLAHCTFSPRRTVQDNRSLVSLTNLVSYQLFFLLRPFIWSKCLGSTDVRWTDREAVGTSPASFLA